MLLVGSRRGGWRLLVFLHSETQPTLSYSASNLIPPCSLHDLRWKSFFTVKCINGPPFVRNLQDQESSTVVTGLSFCFFPPVCQPTARDPQLSPSSQNGVTVPDLAKADDWPTQNERRLSLVVTRSPVSPIPDWWRKSDSRKAFHSRGPYSRPNTQGSWPKVSNKCTFQHFTSYSENFAKKRKIINSQSLEDA